MPVRYIKRIMVAVENEDGSAAVYQLHHATVALDRDDDPGDIFRHSMSDRPTTWTLVANGVFEAKWHRPASDYWPDAPEIAPEQPALNPGG